MKKTPETLIFRVLSHLSRSSLTLAVFHYLSGDCQALPKIPGKTEMVLPFPNGFAWLWRFLEAKTVIPGYISNSVWSEDLLHTCFMPTASHDDGRRYNMRDPHFFCFSIALLLTKTSNYKTRFTTIPHRVENSITKRTYKTNRCQPIAIFSAPRLVIFVAGPVSIKAVADPGLIPLISHS